MTYALNARLLVALWLISSMSASGSAQEPLTPWGPLVVVGAANGTGDVAVLRAPDGTVVAGGSPFGGVGGVRVATGDVNGDGTSDIIVGAGVGGGDVLVFDGATLAPLLRGQPFGAGWAGGVYVAAGDINGDGRADIVVGSGIGGGLVRAFSASGAEIASGFPFSPAFVGGVTVATGDFNGDGRVDVITGMAVGGLVSVFSGVDAALLGSGSPFGALHAGGVHVATGDVNGDGRIDVITAPATGNGSVRVYSGVDISLLMHLEPFPSANGITVAATDVDGDGRADLIVAPGGDAPPLVRIFSGDTTQPLASFLAFDPGFTGGVFVAAAAAMGPRVQFTSAANATFTIDADNTFSVRTTGGAGTVLGVTGTLPAGVTFTSHDDGTGTLAGTPAAGTAGTYTVSFTAARGGVVVAPQAFTLTVEVPSPGPTAAPPTISSTNSTTFTIGAAGLFTVTTTGTPTPAITRSGTLPASLSFADNGNGTATLSGIANAGTAGTYPLVFTASNADGATPQDFTLVILGPPIASLDAYEAAQNMVRTIAAPGVLSNDAINGATIVSYGAATGLEQDAIGNATATAQGGTVTLHADGSLSYTPTNNFTGVDTFTYVLANAAGNATATVTFTVSAAPLAVNDSYSTGVNTVLTVAPSSVLDNDTVNGASIVSFGAATGAEQTTLGAATPTSGGGSVTLTGDGTFVYTPANGFTGADTFLYVLSGVAGSSTATVTVTVSTTPVAVDDLYQAARNTLRTIPSPGVLANDTVLGATIVSFGAPTGTEQTTPGSPTSTAQGGTVALDANGSLDYTPATNFNGADTFKYLLSNASGTSTATVTFTVVDAPAAVADAYDTPVNAMLTVPGPGVLSNDTVNSAAIASYGASSGTEQGTIETATGTAAGGSVTLNADGSFSYTPANNFTGADSFKYVLTNFAGSSTATVTVTVAAPPVAADDAATVGEDSGATTIDVLANDTGSPKTIASVTQPAHGVVLITNAGADLTYQPHANYCNSLNATAADSFTYTVTPGNSSATVAITVTCVNDAPVAQAKLYTAQANMKLVGLSGLLAGVTDADHGVSGCTPSFSVNGVSATSPAGGVISNLNGAAGTFDFEPPPGVTGNVTFTYTVQDDGCPGAATSAPATVTVTIAGPVIWFVDSTAPGGGNGTWTGSNAKAFQTLAQAAAVDASDHRVFVLNSSGASITYTGGIVLNTGEWLVGQGATGASFDAVMGITPPLGTVVRPSINGVRPTFSGTVQVNTRSATNLVRVLGFNLATGTSAGLTNGGTTLNAVTVDLGSVTTTTGTAVSITGTGNGSTTSNSFRFISVSSNGAANGIDLRNAVGTFEVAGDGTNTSVGGNASGGTIASAAGGDGLTSGNGVYLENVQNVTLRRMTINGTNQNHGIRGIGVSGFALEFSTVNGANGTNAGLDEGSVHFDNLTGSAAITSSVIEGGFEDNLNVVNTSGTLNRLTITGSTFGFNQAATGNNSILIEAQNAGTVLNFTIQSSTIKGARADWINASANSGSSMDAIIGGSTGALGNLFDNLGANTHAGAAAGGNRVVLGSTGTMTVDIRNNTTKGSKGEAIRVRATGASGGQTGTLRGHVRNNTIGVQATANSGSSEGSGIFAFGDGGGDMTLAITNNQIVQHNNHGISLTLGDEINDGSAFNITVTGNTVSNPGTLNTDFNAIHLNNGTVGTIDNFTSCVDIGGSGVGNNVSGGGSGTIPPNNVDIRLRQRQSTTVRLPGYGGANNNDAAVIAYLTGRNTLTTAAASNTVPTGGGFIGGGACLLP